MGKRYLRSIVSDLQTLTASADITPVDLPVNPLSHLLLTIEGTATDRTVAGNYSFMSDFVTGITDVSIRHRGENIVQGQLQDLMMLNALLTGYHPWGTKPLGTLAAVRSMTFLLSFSRVPYWHSEAFPATQRGNLRFYMTAGTLPVGFSARRWMLEAVELIEDTPNQFLKYTALTRALTATGRQRMPLPVGNVIIGIQLFDPTDQTTTAQASAFGRLKILKDNVEQYFAESRIQSLQDAFGRRDVSAFDLDGHVHVADAAIAPIAIEEVEFRANEAPIGYAFLDFDPLKDGTYALETEGVSTLDLDLNSDVSTGTVRVHPVELVKVTG